MQEVKIYNDAFKAYQDMNSRIGQGWRIHTCTMGCYMAGYSSESKVLVVYEK